jgi:hypothetical protein
MDPMQIRITAKSRNGQTFQKATVFTVSASDIKMDTPSRSSSLWSGFTKLTVKNGNETNVYYIYESPAEITAQILMNEGQATSLLAKNYVDLSIDAAGANAAAAADIVKTYTEIDTATAATTDGIQLPAAVKGKVVVVINTVPGAAGAGLPLDVWPQTGEKFDALAANAQTTLAAKTIGHWVCDVAGTWITAADYTQV